MANILLPILPGTLPQGYCFTSWQQLLVDFANLLKAVLQNGLSFYNYGDTKPAPERQIYPWLNSSDMRWYRFSGQWITNHGFLPGRHTWEEFATEAEIWSFDGGDGSDPSTVPPTATAGAMWELDTAYAGRSPMSPGVIAGADPAKTLGYGEDFGVGSQAISTDQVPAHTHPFLADAVMLNGANLRTAFSGSGASPGVITGLTGDPKGDISIGANVQPSGAQTKLSVVHPVRGMCCIVRTGRIYRTVP